MVDLIPREVLFGNPERVSPDISPDGSQLAWIAPRDGVLNVWVAPVGAAGVDWDEAKAVTEDTDRGVRVFAWARDGRHLLYLQDTGGDENWRLYDVDMETMARRDLTPFDGIQARIIATRKSHRDEVLVGINRDNPQLHDVYQLSLTSGELAKLIENPGYAGWIADEDMVVRGALSPLPDGGFDVLVRDAADDDWRTLVTIPADDVAASDVLAFSGDGRSLLAISSIDTDTGRLVRVDLGTGEAEVLLEDPEADVAGAMLHPDTRDPQIVEVLKDRTEYHVLDPSVEHDWEAIQALHPGDPQPAGRDEADNTWLIAFTDDAGPVQYYAYDRTSQAGSFLFSSRPELSRYDLARMEPFSFKARDGLTIHGYVTFPPESLAGGRSGLPTVLNVHGGPQARDAWGWDPEAQWLANRGYLVHPGELPRLDRLRQVVRGGRRPRVGRQDARRPAGRGPVRGRSGLGRPGQGRDLRRVLRRLRGPGGRGVHPGRVLLRGRHRGPVEPADAAGVDPAVLEADGGGAVPAGRQPGDGQGVPVVALAAVPGP